MGTNLISLTLILSLSLFTSVLVLKDLWYYYTLNCSSLIYQFGSLAYKYLLLSLMRFIVCGNKYNSFKHLKFCP